ncbi:MAG TPA: SMP-30/gluconolactonase/LRE family protein [Acidimicrobiales bacterium]
MNNYQSRVLRKGLSFGEAPRWHEGRLWYSDFYRHGVFSIDERGTEERLEHTVLGQPSGLGWLPNGDMLCVSMTDHQVLRLHKGTSTLFADISKYCGFWANDMVTSTSGVSYVGNFGFDLDVLLRDEGVEGLMATPPPTTNVVVLNSDGAVIQVVPKMAFPNGSVITPDGKTLIVGETMTFCLNAFDINHNGTLANRRVWAQLDFVATDGMCLDADGQIWLANALTNQVLRVKEGGEITAVVETTMTAFACMLGGSDQKTLYVMTAPSSDRFKVADSTDGAIEVASVPVKGAGRP